METNWSNFKKFQASVHTRSLGGDLLVIRNNDCITIARNHTSKAVIKYVEGEWTEEEKEFAKHLWLGSEASQR